MTKNKHNDYNDLLKMHKECKKHNAHLIKALDEKDQLLSNRSVRIINLEHRLKTLGAWL
jgi:hypothetical protein